MCIKNAPAQSDLNHRFPLSWSLDTVEYVDEQQRPWSDCACAVWSEPLLFVYGIRTSFPCCHSNYFTLYLFDIKHLYNSGVTHRAQYNRNRLKFLFGIKWISFNLISKCSVVEVAWLPLCGICHPQPVYLVQPQFRPSKLSCIFQLVW